MTRRSRDILMIAITAVGFLGGWIWLSIPTGMDRSEVLSKTRAMARSRRFEDARVFLDRHLKIEPNDLEAHLLYAQVATDSPDPKPELALDHLSRLHPSNKASSAIVAFLRGKAEYQRARYDLAEEAWNEALRLDPSVPEAGSALLDLLEREGRLEEAYTVGRRTFDNEPNARDRVRLLFELARLDIERPDPEGVVILLEPLVPKVPDNLPVTAAYGLALVHTSRTSKGVEALREMIRRHPDSADAWWTWLTGLDDAGCAEELTEEFAKIPKSIANDPRFIKFEGVVAYGKGDLAGAVAAYNRVLAREPNNSVILYRLSRVHRLLGPSEEAKRVAHRLKTYQDAYLELRDVVIRSMDLNDLGTKPQPDLYSHLADLRVRMRRIEEAKAWYELVLKDTPGHAPSLEALERLKSLGTNCP